MAKKKTSTKKNSHTGAKIALGATLVAAAAAGYFLFGPKGKDNRKKVKGWTLKAKGEILEKIENLEHVTEDKYHTIVDQITKKYAKAKNRTEKEVVDFEKEAKKYWNHIKRDLAGKVSKQARSVAQKADKAKKSSKKIVAYHS